ncbi:protein-glutamate O-methyltransferase CheR [Teredinibacter sp. KSP-S5-2]|uniref:CheR family methyltransferase n=1 Tax=Teredinibacter sp. KSP-S5-2 TaxID=3034506 RepID=UPI002934D83C|nr:protein-glutamate O-methyltransferase CheR [Teredinibacter sp. KSP-S5-2]WNO07912.1 protein-glutamate O-methyltransferase CheR [Teredinibacter sp. KSP-S5-2]
MKAIDDFSDREFPMTDKDFKEIQNIAYTRTGISLSHHKKNMIYGRLARRLRRLGLNSFAEYLQIISQDNEVESVEFINAITTNLTSFFRENHHFEYLRSTVLPNLIKRNAKERRIRIWSAGCSTGEEPYSIAMVLKDCAALNSWDVKVLATDLDSNVVQSGKEGVYLRDRAENIPDTYRKFLATDKRHEYVRVKENVRGLITFKKLNLMHDWPMKGPFDVIFCRNVVIYFNAETQRRLFDRYATILKSDGYLFIGHSENLHKVSNRFDSLGRTMYQRII